MTSADGDEKKPSLFEQHAQTGLAVVATTIMLGSGGLLVAMRDDVSVLKRDVQHLTDQIKSGVDDRFRGNDWRREERVIIERFQRLEQRVDRLEGIRK